MPMLWSRPSFSALQCLYGASPFVIRRTARCVLYYNTILPRGPAARPRWIPPACGASPASSLVPRQRNVWPLHHHSRERSCSPENPMTISLRPVEISLSPGPHRPGGVPAPLDPRPTLRGLDARQRFAAGPRAGVSPPASSKGDVGSPFAIPSTSLRRRLRRGKPGVRRLDPRQGVSTPARRPRTAPGGGLSSVAVRGRAAIRQTRRFRLGSRPRPL